MTTKTKRIISMVLIVLLSFVLLMGGVMKLLGREPEMVMQFLTKVGFVGYLKILGICELLIAALFLYPKTNKIGFLLTICYFSAALSLEISGGQPPISAVFVALAWIAMFLKNREVFFNV